MTKDVLVVDYGLGNLFSVQRALEHCGATVTLSSDPEQIATAGRVVLPGVGAFGDGIAELRKRGLDEALRVVWQRGNPLLGICLGMQLLLDESEEFGHSLGLGIIPGKVISIPVRTLDDKPQKVPHIGWNALTPANGDGWQNTLLADLTPGDAVYFVHSFMASPNDEKHRVADCIYGGQAVSAVIARDNVLACQFHPEKSGEIGLKVLRRFLTWNPAP